MAPGSLGVVVGRFQVPELHAGHRHVLDTARTKHARLLIVIGDHGHALSPKNPLPFDVRRAMLLEEYPEAQISALRDHPSDEVWSETLDALIEGSGGKEGTILYGSRDSFIPFYSGRFPTEYLEPVESPSGTDLRSHASRIRAESAPFRHSAIYEHANVFKRGGFWSRFRNFIGF